MFNRLQYFARGLQVYIRQLRVALQGKTGDALKTEEVTVKLSLQYKLCACNKNANIAVKVVLRSDKFALTYL